MPARVASATGALALSFGKATWDFLEACGRQRASREMLAVAESMQSQHPEAAARLRAAAKRDA